MIHKISRLLMTLVALFALTTHAWAEESETIETKTDGVGIYTGTHFKITASLGCDVDGIVLWNPQNTASGTAKIEALNGEYITKIEMHMRYGGNVATYTTTTAGHLVATDRVGAENDISVTDINATSVTIGTSSNTPVGWVQINKFVIYYTIEVNPVAEPAEGTKQWTFTQPGSNVVLTPIYAKTAAFATTGTEPDVTTLLPEAAEGVIAGTDAPLIVEGTVAFAGTSTEVKQGTVMYAVTLATVTEAPALTSSDWKNTVPTAKDIADGGAEVKVWYYIQGADAPEGEAATLDNTFNNSDVCATPLTVTVLSNLFDLTLKAANVNTIDATQASKGSVTVKEGTGAAVDKTGDITDGKLKAIKMGSEVKLNTKPGYKFRKVEVKKDKKTLTITNGNQFSTPLDITGCTTWDEVIAKNPDMIQKDEDGYIHAKTGSYVLIKGGAAVIADNPFDPNATDYKWAK